MAPVYISELINLHRALSNLPLSGLIFYDKLVLIFGMHIDRNWEAVMASGLKKTY